jgi:inner membrane protein
MSVLGHVAIGMATARAVTTTDGRTKTLALRMVALVALAALPDVDFLLHELAPSIDFLDHRVATHSLAFAVAVVVCVSILMIGLGADRSTAWGLIAGAVVASHGLLDVLGDSHLGVALLWPFSNTRFLAPWHPLPNPAIEDLFMGHELDTLAFEFLLFLPFWLYALLPRKPRVTG